ncbi:efflux RND transporter periplasmic adaptor subunit [Gemmata sp.]|uniref:efflux RND transporter periplasmic adaptor subunit n=1 Tax=Gemmata sp. TaxID=1914242 RepID=UPI003F6E93BE
MLRPLPILASVIALAGAGGCGKNPPAPAAAPAATAPQIAVVKPERRAVKREVEQPGIVHAFEETVLRARLTAYVGEIAEDPHKVARLKTNTPEKQAWPPHDRLIDIGSRVKKGDVLARLAVPELDQEVAQKLALVKQAEAEVVQAQKALEAAGANVAAVAALVAEADAGVDRTQALAESWQKEVDRFAKLVTGGVGDLQTRDETLNQFKAAGAGLKGAVARVASARAAVKKAQADRDKAAADVTAAQAREEVARADAARVKALRGYASIVAPFDGVVTRRSVNTGDFVAAGDRTELFCVARLDPVRVVVHVPEADAALVAVGQAVRLSLPTGKAAPGPGTVARVAWSLEPGSRTLRTEVDVPNPDEAVRPGMYVHAKLSAELPAAWSVPAAAIGKAGDEPVMYLVQGGKAVRVRVELLRGDAQFTQVKRYKLPGAGDWTEVTGAEAVASPAAALADGQSVP